MLTDQTDIYHTEVHVDKGLNKMSLQYCSMCLTLFSDLDSDTSAAFSLYTATDA